MMNTTRKLNRLDAISLALLGGAAAITAALYSRLPESVPTHFDLRGNADAWMSKPIGATLLLGIAFLVWLLVRFGAAILPHGMRERLRASPVSIVGLLTTGLFAVLQLLILWAALHAPGSIGRPLGAALGVYWIVLAQVLPRVRRNPFIGIRTTWTLTSDENWARTHRFASVTFTLGGLVAVFAAVVAAPAISVIAILASALVPVVWSFIVAHRLPPEA
jgi:uncharacterized membrane protein